MKARTPCLSTAPNTPGVVALEARKAHDTAGDHNGDGDNGTRADTTGIASLTERRLRKPLPIDTRPLPTVDQYDRLLRRRTSTHN